MLLWQGKNILNNLAEEKLANALSPVAHTENVTRCYLETKKTNERKKIGQYFTPKSLALTAVRNLKRSEGRIRILDAGSGTGMLSAALIEKLCEWGNVEIEIDAVENDKEVIPYLTNNLEYISEWALKRGVKVNFNILNVDFTSFGANLFRLKLPNQYDIVISNPPYYKIKKDSEISTNFRDFSSGQMNIFSIFLAVASSNVAVNGSMIGIIPMSFTNGISFSKFRKFILSALRLQEVTVFGSRESQFIDETVLQKIMILHLSRSEERLPIRITEYSSKDYTRNINSQIFPYQQIVNKQFEIDIPPLSREQRELYDKVLEYDYRLSDFGLEVTTGSIVPHEDKDYLAELPGIPLIWMTQIGDNEISWPANNKQRPNFIDSASSSSKKYQSGEYILIRRCAFSGTKKHIYCSLFKGIEGYEFFSLENHVNFIYVIEEGLAKQYPNLLHYIHAYMRSDEVSAYFRARCTSTQVNVTDIRSLPIPSYKDLIKWGQ